MNTTFPTNRENSKLEIKRCGTLRVCSDDFIQFFHFMNKQAEIQSSYPVGLVSGSLPTIIKNSGLHILGFLSLEKIFSDQIS